MASFSLEVKGLNQAIKDMEGDVQEFLVKADRKFKVAGARMETYAKAAAPVDIGFHKRNIKHIPNAPFLSTVLIAAADYASVLEFGFYGPIYVESYTRRDGTPVGGYLFFMSRPPRPHIIPAAERALNKLIEDLNGLA